MTDAASLWLYFLTVAGVIALPGMDMAFILGSTVSGGRTAGLAAVGGVVAGGVLHMAVGATGLSVVLAVMPGLVAVMLIAGAAYVAWIGWTLLRSRDGAALTVGAGATSAGRSFAGALATCLLNPKAYVFMLAIFPQFVHAERGSIWMQAGTLAAITACTQIAIYGGLALAMARTTAMFHARPGLRRGLATGVGAVLIATAALTVAGAVGAP